MFRYDDFERLAVAQQPDFRSARHLELNGRRSSNQSNPPGDFGDSEHGSKSDAGFRKTRDLGIRFEKPIAEPEPSAVVHHPPIDRVARTAEWFSGYLRQQREHYSRMARPLSKGHKARLSPYFSPELLDEIRFVELHGAHVANPEFLLTLRANGFDLPSVSHMDSLTFGDVIVFNEELSERGLFHALVHAVQFRILGLQGYAHVWTQGVIKTKAHFKVPLEVHAFSLAAKFPVEKFCVEDHVLRWVIDGQY